MAYSWSPCPLGKNQWAGWKWSCLGRFHTGPTRNTLGCPFRPSQTIRKFYDDWLLLFLSQLKWCRKLVCTLFRSVCRALSLALYFRHCLIQLWTVHSRRYQQFGLWRNLGGRQTKSVRIFLVVFFFNHEAQYGDMIQDKEVWLHKQKWTQQLMIVLATDIHNTPI